MKSVRENYGFSTLSSSHFQRFFHTEMAAVKISRPPKAYNHFLMITLQFYDSKTEQISLQKCEKFQKIRYLV